MHPARGAPCVVLWVGLFVACHGAQQDVRNEGVSAPAEERLADPAGGEPSQADRQAATSFARALQVKLQNRPITLSLRILGGKVKSCRVEAVGGSTDDVRLVDSADADTLCGLVGRWQFDVSSPKEVTVQFGAGHLQ